jgi:hypothetical protein
MEVEMKLVVPLMPLLLVGGCVLLGVIGLSLTRWRRRRKMDSGVEFLEPRSLVRVLRGEEDLKEAVWRAVQFERGAASVLMNRADRYEALIAPTPITDIRATRRSLAKDPNDDQVRLV